MKLDELFGQQIYDQQTPIILDKKMNKNTTPHKLANLGIGTLSESNVDEGKLGNLAKAGAIALSTMGGDAQADNTRNNSQSEISSTRPVSRPSKQTITNEFNEKVLLAALKKIYTDKKEIAAFMAQAYHETMGFSRLEEYGNDNYFKQYDIEHNPRKAKMLGNTEPGDGLKYKGRSFNHITGRYNYQKIQDELGIPVIDNPELLSDDIVVAAKVAVHYWNKRVRKNVSNWDDVKSVTKAINGGYNGLEKREKLYKHYLNRINL